jgi:hypothetical protein
VKAIARLEGNREQRDDQRDRLKGELQQIEARLARLIEALVDGGPLETVVAQIKVEESGS